MITSRGVQDCVQLDRRPQWVDQELLVTVGGLGSSPGVAISLVEVRPLTRELELETKLREVYLPWVMEQAHLA